MTLLKITSLLLWASLFITYDIARRISYKSLSSQERDLG
jgi:hypothetical protein